MAKLSNARVPVRDRRGEYVAGAELQYVYRCAACGAERWRSFGRLNAPVRLLTGLPAGWVMLNCESSDQNVPMHFWLCSGCAATPEESRALAALRHPIRILP